jgi:hypothetical protein
MNMTEAGSAISDHAVHAFEIRFGLRLPPLYQKFLSRHNGGVPERRWFRIPGHYDGWDLLDFFSGLGHPNELMNTERGCSDLPEYVSMGLLPIGGTASAGVLCVDTRGQGGEVVVYLDAAEYFAQPERKTRYIVASNALSLLSLLEAEPG